jgi:hypothetical protein
VSRPRLSAVAACLALVLVAPGCGDDDPSAEPGTSQSSAAPTPSEGPQKVRKTHRPIKPKATPSSAPTDVQPRVLAISIDGLNPEALQQLGEAGTPTIHRLFAEGAGTIDARTEVEQTVTLPNHTGMVTGRPIDRANGGHGVTWNEDLTGKAIPKIASVFTVVHDAGGSSAVFAGKSKFSLWQRSWPDAVDRSEIIADPAALTAAAIDDLTTQHREFTFLHLAGPDTTGHIAGFMSSAYLDAVRSTDALVGQVLAAIEADPELRSSIDVILTADHGGEGPSHGDAADPDNYTIPFVVWGPGITHGDLYALNADDYRSPGTGRPSYDGVQPVRNGDLANLATDLLGLGPVPGSELDAAQDLTVAP